MRPRAFVDSWGWVALAVSDDPEHGLSESLIRRLQTEGALLVTSNLVVAESLTRLRYDFGLPAALDLLATIELLVESRSASVLFVDEPLWSQAVAWFRRYDDQRFSMVDCTSFAIMEALGITTALTADRHFATTGFAPLGL